jgi:small redox-active disulfide protein 2
MLSIKILGPGCPNCQKVEAHARQALATLPIETGYEVTKVTNPVEISNYILRTPGLVINEQVVCEGRIPRVEEVKQWLTAALETSRN